MNIKALPSMGQRLFCCFCFVESAVCSTFAERIIRGSFRGCTCLKCTNRVRSTPPELHQQSKKCTNRATLVHLRQVHPLKAPTEQEVRQQCYVGALETSAPPEVRPLSP